jgi:putative PIN family toxin of toxin-antitoxin system
VRRLVVDPGVLVSAIITPLGPPAEILRAVARGRVALVVCPHLLAELLGVLRRDKFRSYLTIEEAERYVAGIASRAETRQDPQAVSPITRDPKDDYLIALAREAAADVIVSGDADLLLLERIEPPILSPSRLIEEFAREST